MRVNESGRSMIEMLGVLAIIGVLSVGGIAGYSKAMNKFKTNKVADQVSMIVTNIRTLYAQQTTYAGLENKTAISMGVIPDELGSDATSGSLTNPFNGRVFVESATAGANMAGGSDDDEKAFIVAYEGLSREACVTLATNDWGSGYSSGLIGLKVLGEYLSDHNLDPDELRVGCTGVANSVACAGSNMPFQVSQAATACACGTANECSITWKFY